MSDEEEERFELEQRLLNSDFNQIPHTPSAWEQDIYDVDEDPDPRGTPEKEILWAAEQGDLILVKSLISKQKNLINVQDTDGYTPLHRASYSNHLPIVELLLRNGANPNARTTDQWTPLHSACKWNNVKCVSKLIEAGSDINAVTSGGISPLHLVAELADSHALLELLLSQPNIQSDLNVHNSTADKPSDITSRKSANARLFEYCEPCFNCL
ncbi:ankyrin repeat domain-containing protein 49-like [Adelges cooleyi]|uniref:ankyrin repeat domain-containing protein 49-like n=1 Tax=Adelges cooleyi TaxID=133065 RepID=UPI0021805E89|nr:ankyrin repeat domain-containing protein 49-like [Adelges cooleyi]XP_050441240.1 ankyrin repeat domain-containing protein 49-like [Adelges cooleyi]